MLNKYKLLDDPQKRFQFCTAVSRLKQTDDFTLLVDVLGECLESIDKKTRTAASPDLEWGQGAAQFLDELLQTIGSAEALRNQLRKLHEAKETPSGFG